MSLHTIEDLTSCILDFQANMVRVTYRKKTTLVDPENEPTHAEALGFIWECSRLEVDEDELGSIIQWRKFGFESEDIIQEFSEVGVLGLDCLVYFLFPFILSPPTNVLFHRRENLSRTTRISRRSELLVYML
jgi:engulfment/cell motility protein 1